jgi:CheY-like chemotaxis protein
MTVSERATSSAPLQGHAAIEVLIAEDDPMFRKILQSWLESWDYHLTVAEDGTQAWNILQRERPPQLLVIDRAMPGIDGMELCRRIRSSQGTSYQYILVVTAKDG